jgi:hypothetical protein
MLAAFDPSLTHFGWVVFDENKVGKESVLETGVFKTDPSDGYLIQRLIMQRERVRILLASRGIRFVTMEAPILQEFSTEVLYAVHFFVHEVFLDLGVFLILIHSSTWKSIMFPGTNPNDVTKHHSSHLAKMELDIHGKRFSEHIADAYHLGKIGHRFYHWHVLKDLHDDDLTPHEHDLFCGKHTFTKGPKKGLTEYTGIIYRENELFFDYSKQARNSKILIKDLQNG